MLEQTDPALLAALKDVLPRDVGVDTYNTGGGVMVTRIVPPDVAAGLLERPDAGIIEQIRTGEVWVTREDKWLLGFYDFRSDEDDDGVFAELLLVAGGEDDPRVVAGTIARMLYVMGVQ